jgi:ribose 5-phosphate isomerase
MRWKNTFLTALVLLVTLQVQAQFPCFSGTTINAGTGSDTLDLCLDVSTPIVDFGTSTNALPFAYVVVDESGTIVYIDTENTIDFSQFPSGNFQVYAFNFIGSITASVGDPLDGTPLAGGCFALTSNFITISGDAISGGMVSTEDGATEAFTCPGDGLADLIQFDSSGVDPGLSYTYVVTDENNIIIDVPIGDVYDFEDAGTGIYRVWGLAYSGNITAMIGDDAGDTQLADNCFALSSNFVTVYSEEPDGGTVMTEDGATEVSFCIGSGEGLIAFDSMDVSNSNFTYVVTDEDNVILDVPSGDVVDFENSPAGVCRVWGLAYTGNITAMVGDTASAIDLTDACFDLSDNFVTVTKEEADGGTVSTEDGETEIFVCVGDGEDDFISFDSMDVSGPSFTYVVTDENNVILSVPSGDEVNFEDGDAEIVRVWGLAYSGSIIAMVGDTASAVALSDGCFDLSDNFVTVNRGEPDGGTVATEDGETEVFTCPGDGVADVIQFDSMDVSGPNFTYVITDDSNVILDVPGSDMNDFEDAGTGISRVWGLAYTGNITAMVGDTASAVPLTDGCFDLSDNFITVYREQPDGGMVMTEDGATEVFTCPGDSIPDVIFFDSTGVSNSNFTYVITDDNNVILGVPGSDSNDFEDAGTGTSRVWGLAYTGNITAMVGDTASAVALTDECFDLSDNFITVYHEQPDGGTVSTEMGMDTVAVCVGDGVPNIIRFDSAGVSNSNFTYVITDDNNVILGVPSDDSNDFEDAGTGTSRVWGLAYTGNITAMVGDTASAIALTDECFDLSDNFIVVNHTEVNGGTVSTEMGMDTVDVCVGDGVADIIRFDSADVVGPNFTYVITDDNNIILGVPGMDTVNFDDAGGGVSRVWGLAYSGTITAMAGDTASAVALTDGCFDLSDNFIVVNRDEVNGGTVSTEDGETEVFACIGDGLPDIIRFDSMDVSGPNFTYVITDDNNVILEVPGSDFADFEDAGAAIRRVWGLAYSGNIIAMVGDTASAVDLSDGCFDLSDNFITVTRDSVEGGTVSTEDGETEVYTCPGDSIPDIIRFDSTGATGESFTYVITDDNNVIIALPAMDMADFDDAGEGTYRVWGLSYSGNITAMAGDTASAVALADECFALSDNFITVYSEQPDGGMVMTEDGATEVYTCPGDSIPDIVRFDSSGVSNSLFTYVITDENNVILGVPSADSNDFEDAGTGTSRVWGLAYTGNITAMVGDTASAVALTDDCFDLSDNFITVFREQPEGGTVSTEMGMDTVEVCVGDGVPDIVRFDSAGVSGQFTYVITDENNVILSVPSMDMADFEDAESDVSRVWGLAYTGNIIATVGDTASAVDLSDGCFDLSDNFIVVNRNEVDGGMVATEDDEEVVYICTSDTLADVIVVDSSGTDGPNFTYVVTDDNNVILDVPASDTIDLSAAPPGISRVWGLSYTGNITAMVGDTASAVALTDGCFSLSSNFVTAFRDDPEGGTVSTEAGADTVTACAGDGLSDFVQFDSSGTSLSNFTYVITDTNNIFIGIFDGDEFDFESTSIDAFRIWGLSYTGNLLALPGDDAANTALTDECFDLSDNFVTVLLERVDGGTLAFVAPTAAENDNIAYVCPSGDSEVTIINSTVTSDSYSFILTDSANVILSIQDQDIAEYDFANATEAEEFFVYGINGAPSFYNLGDTLSLDSLQQTPCVGIASNVLSIVAEQPDGGTVTTEQGETEIDLILGGSQTTIVRFDSIDTSNSYYAYVVTLSDADNTIVDVVEDGDEINFASLSADVTYRVWGLAYTGFLNDVQTALEPLSTDCFSLSENFVTVNTSLGLVSGNSGNSLLLRSWPNPATDQLTVQIDATFERVSGETAVLQIVSLTGNVLETRRVDAQTQTVQLDINRLSAGAYWVRYRSGQAVQTQQFVKE